MNDGQVVDCAARYAGWRRAQGVRLLSALGAISACVVLACIATPTAAAQQGDPAGVISAYESARNRGDMNTVVGLFADDAVVIDEAGTVHRGPQQIGLLLKPGISPDWAADPSNCSISGDHIFCTERVGVHGTARFLNLAAIVNDGSIQAMSYGGRELLPAEASNQDGAPVVPAAFALAGFLLAVLCTIDIGAVLTPHGRRSALRGSLLAHLQRWCEDRSDHQPRHRYAAAPSSHPAVNSRE